MAKEATGAEIGKALAKVNKQLKTEAEARGEVDEFQALGPKSVQESAKRGKVVSLVLNDFRKFKVKV